MSEVFNTKEFSKEIRVKRAMQDYSLRELGERLKISAATLQRVESGTIPNVETFNTICGWLDADMKQFFFKKRNPRKKATVRSQ